ncbi:hypothetical protein, partial [Propionivibrio sp.]|uniref:hypothetical protein n=1 Tax=Propionivibrio sp. TaxID=2212460 RepID=UPI003BEF91DE
METNLLRSGMSNITESAVWEAGVYKIETGDYLLGGTGGTLNVQPSQLANRTAYLKSRADQVDNAASGFGSLDARLDGIEATAASLGPDMQNMSVASIMFALDQSALANRSINVLRKQAQQEGEFTVLNKGIKSGCAATKSTTAARNLSLSAGAC